MSAATRTDGSGGEAILETRGLGRRFRRGEVLGVIGPSGAGKTTLFNVVTGFLPPTSGRCAFCGRDIDGDGEIATPQRSRRPGLPRHPAAVSTLDLDPEFDRSSKPTPEPLPG